LIVIAFVVALVVSGYASHTGPDYQFRTGKDAFARGDLDAVLTAAEALSGVNGYEPHRHLLEGMILLRKRGFVEAIIEFGYAKDHPDTAALAHTLSGEALYNTRQFRDAQRILTKAIQLDPSQIDARRWLAATYFDIGAMNHAVDQLQAVAQQAPGDPRPHRLLGLIYKDFEQYGKAIAAYRQSLRRNPDQPAKSELSLELAECLVHQRRHAEALEALRQCPRSAGRLVFEAECHYAGGDEDAARKLLHEALRLEPEHLGGLQLDARMAQESGDVESAARTLRRAAAAHPKEWRVRYQLGRVYQQLGKRELAEEELKTMQQLRTLRDHFTTLHEQAMKDPTDAQTRYQLGVTAGELGKPELAADWFMTALALDPDHPEAREALNAMIRPSLPSAEGSSKEPGSSGDLESLEIQPVGGSGRRTS
jgi:tetratricopeptide (TPR) repeat protein